MPVCRTSISFLCPACVRVVRAAAPMAGRTSVCPECDAPVTVPAVGLAERETVEETLDAAALARLRASAPAAATAAATDGA